MLRTRVVQLLALIVALVGLVVMMAWFLDILPLTTLIPGASSMKFTTALSFFFTALVLLMLVRVDANPNDDISTIVLPISSMCILLLMTTSLAASLSSVPIGLEEWFVKEPEIAIVIDVPGRPSVGTMTNFSLISIVAILGMLNFSYSSVRRSIGIIIGLIASVALFGYAIGDRRFYYVLEGFSTGMAIHTAVLFILIAAVLVMLGGCTSCHSKRN